MSSLAYTNLDSQGNHKLHCIFQNIMMIPSMCVCPENLSKYSGAQKSSDTHAIYIEYCTNMYFFEAVVIITSQFFTAVFKVASSCWLVNEAWLGDRGGCRR